MFRRLAAFAAVILLLTVSAMAETVFPPGLQVGLTPAGDLRPSTAIAGFDDPDRKVSVGIVQAPASAYGEFERALSGKPPPGTTGVARESFAFEAGNGLLVTAHGTEHDVAFHRWILLANAKAGDKAFVAVINVTVPDTALAVYSDDAVRRMLKSVAFRPPPIAEQLALIPFRLGELAGFRVVQVMSSGVVVLTGGPKDDLSEQPYIIVSIARGEAAKAEDRARFARDLLASVPLRDMTLKSAEDMRIGGRPGFEIRAEAKTPEGAPVSLVQWVRFSGGAFIRIVGVTSPDKWDAMFDRFRSVRDGIALR
jgi:hypothetical protein